MDNEGSKLFIVTDLNAPNKRIKIVDFITQKQKTGKTSFLKLRMYCHHQPVAVLFANYMIDAVSAKQYDYSGKTDSRHSAAGIGNSGRFYGKKTKWLLFLY
jgi:prolyl oligopeptidase